MDAFESTAQERNLPRIILSLDPQRSLKRSEAAFVTSPRRLRSLLPKPAELHTPLVGGHLCTKQSAWGGSPFQSLHPLGCPKAASPPLPKKATGFPWLLTFGTTWMTENPHRRPPCSFLSHPDPETSHTHSWGWGVSLCPSTCNPMPRTRWAAEPVCLQHHCSPNLEGCVSQHCRRGGTPPKKSHGGALPDSLLPHPNLGSQMWGRVWGEESD